MSPTISVPRKASRRFKADSRLLAFTLIGYYSSNGFAVQCNGNFFALLHLPKMFRQGLA